MVKHYKKISDVCQLVKNGDFSDGTNWNYGTEILSHNISNNKISLSVGAGGSRANLYQPIIPVRIGHAYLIGCNITPLSGTIRVYFMYGHSTSLGATNISSSRNFSILFIPDWDAAYNAQIAISTSNCSLEVSNFQLFDLTEMYGAGNEPTTVEQFKQDFPLDYYPYSPKCWVSYYKKNYLTNMIGTVDLGSLDWKRFGLYFETDVFSKIKSYAPNVLSNIKCTRYITRTATIGDGYDNGIGTYNQIIRIFDSNYTNATLLKQSLSGVKLFYELESPGTSTVSTGYIPTYKSALRVDTKNLVNFFRMPGTVSWGASNTTLNNMIANLPNGTYTISANFTLNSITEKITGALYGFVIVSVVQSRPTWGTDEPIGSMHRVSMTFTLTDSLKEDFKLYFYGYGTNATGGKGTVIVDNIQIEEGSTATDYVPYGKID